MPILQEKFQTTLPGKMEDGEGWTTFGAVRRTGQLNAGNHRGVSKPINPDDSVGVSDGKFNLMPVGYDATSSLDKFVDGGYAGSTDVTDDVNIPNLVRGYTGHKMGMTDDLYTGEHVDHFYGDADGFVERNNYLDRL